MNIEKIICRSCGNSEMRTILDLGDMPLANALKSQDLLAFPEKRYPLKLVYCASCSLIQITKTVNPNELFDDYLYFSSFSDTMLKHAKLLVESLIDELHLSSNHLVIEIASNDGYLLQFFKEKNIQILGIEPAKNIAKIARDKGIPTLGEYFNKETVSLLLNQKKYADVIIGLNVLAHVAELNNFVEGMKQLLKPHGRIVLEFPYLTDLIKKLEFDTIYHEHLCYFSLHALCRLFERHDLEITYVEELPIHGGSLRIYVNHHGYLKKPDKSVKVLLKKEENEGILTYEYYLHFGLSIMRLKKNTLELLTKLKNEGKTIVGYGAAAKGSTLLNFYGIGNTLIDYIADRNPYKQGKYMSGTRIPIVHPDMISKTKPDYVLILPWNIQEEIIDQLGYIRNWGGQFIIPIPEIRVV